jgi:molybdenum cofactor cytidylyltransferase
MVALDGPVPGRTICCVTALVLLGAGRGSRFGGGKLGAALAGKPLACHAADKLARLPFSRLIVVCSDTTPDLPGFERIDLHPADGPLSRSIATGIGMIANEDAVLIALADMPLVPITHFQALLAAFDGNMVASSVDERPMVPAVFGAKHFASLKDLTGDRGAGALLFNAPTVPLDTALALDVDTPDDLLRAEHAISTWDAIR